MRKKIKANKPKDDSSLARVLYQKLGNDWYAFTEIDGDCFMNKVSAAVVEKAQREREPSVELFQDSRKRNKAA